MKTRIRKIESQTSAQQDQVNELIKSLPKEVRKERQQQIDSLQKAMSKSMRTIRDTPGAGSGAGSFAGSVTRSRASTAASSQQLPPPLRGNNRPAFQQSPPEGYFAPASRRSSQASQQSSTKQRQQAPSVQKQQDQAKLRDRRQSNSNWLRDRAIQESPVGSDASRTAPGAAFQRPQIQMEVAFRQLSGSQSARSLARSESARSLASSQSARSLARSESNRSLKSARMGGSQSARNLPSARMGSARDYGRPRSARSSAASSPAYSDFSGCSTPIAGRTWGHLTRSHGNGIGKQVYPERKDNLIVGDFFRGMNDSFDRTNEDDVQSGIERCIGHGKKMWAKCPSAASHLHGAVPVASIAKSGFSGDIGDLIQAQEGLDANIGHGIKKFSRDTHGRHHISDDTESEPGLHGHHKHEDYKDGMWYCIGHGKRRVAPGHEKDTRTIPPAPTPGSPKVNRVAGLSTRDVTRSGTSFDPSRKGTHLDRQQKAKGPEKARCPFAERMM